MTVCALYRLPIKTIGRLISAHDATRQDFVFPICGTCTTRLNRLPIKLQRRQMDIAIRTLNNDRAALAFEFSPMPTPQTCTANWKRSIFAANSRQKNSQLV